ncbi:hypothetical protein BGY98DRAFT_202667 [Russula aff. rugulosa BPL654]|nr:hypothetical protein BGY98DRAFT_202667 [Russula aff. rugulosa BPL654]
MSTEHMELRHLMMTLCFLTASKERYLCSSLKAEFLLCKNDIALLNTGYLHSTQGLPPGSMSIMSSPLIVCSLWFAPLFLPLSPFFRPHRPHEMNPPPHNDRATRRQHIEKRKILDQHKRLVNASTVTYSKRHFGVCMRCRKTCCGIHVGRRCGGGIRTPN